MSAFRSARGRGVAGSLQRPDELSPPIQGGVHPICLTHSECDNIAMRLFPIRCDIFAVFHPVQGRKADTAQIAKNESNDFFPCTSHRKYGILPNVRRGNSYLSPRTRDMKLADKTHATAPGKENCAPMNRPPGREAV